MPKVSVIIPVYNVEKYLGECLDSVLRQTLKDIEIICVNDGSTDGSAVILAEYAQKDPRIRIITQPNAGLSAARNAGMDVASGKYIYFLDSDDWIVDDAMEKCYAISERDDLDQLVFGCETHVAKDVCCVIDREMARLKEAYYRIDETLCGKVFAGADLLSMLLSKRRYFAAVPLRFMRLDAIRAAALRFPDKLIHEDEYFTPLSLLASQRAEIVCDKFYRRRLRMDSIETVRSVDGNDEARHLAHLIAVMFLLGVRLDEVVTGKGKECGEAADAIKRYLLRSCVRRSLAGREMLPRALRMASGLLDAAGCRGFAAFRRRLRFVVLREKIRRRLARLMRRVVGGTSNKGGGTGEKGKE